MTMTMTSRERLLCALAGEIPDRVPYYETSIDYPFICRLLERPIATDEYFDSGEYVTLDIADQLRVNEVLHRDNMILSCLPPIPAVKRPGKDRILFFHDGKVKSRDDLEALEMPDVTTEEYRRGLREFVATAREAGYAAVALTRCGISATYLAIGFEEFFLRVVDDPDFVEDLMRRYAEWTAGLVPVLDEVGFDVIHTADDVCGKTGPLISPDLYRERFWPHVRKIADAIAATNLKWCYHSDGDLSAVLDDLLDLGIDALNPVEPACMDIAALKERLGDRLVLVGNVDVDLLSGGTPEQVEAAVLDLLRRVAPAGGYVLASGNSVVSYAKVDNVRAMCETNYRRGRYPIRLS